MQRHAEEGARIIDRLGFLGDAVPAIRHHHERWDGAGYPDGLAGEEIPLGARIIHVADALDSMLTNRIYKAARPADEALDASSGGRRQPVLPSVRRRPGAPAREREGARAPRQASARGRLLAVETATIRPVNDLLHSAELQLRATKRILPKAPLSRQRFGRRDDRYVFVVGSPRSGTTFLGESIGSVPGLLDLGEVEPLKDAIRRIAHLDQAETAAQIRRLLIRARRLSLVGGIRPVEQTPEMAHILPAVVEAFPQGRVVHALRDGRDVVCSLLERGWLRAENKGRDYAGPPFGPRARFWVEEERRDEFPQVSDARRAAWAWRRYVTAVRTSGVPVTEVRYERMATDPEAVGTELAEALDISAPDMIAALRKAHTESIGRYARDLTEEELADVLAEAGDLLEELGYLQRV